MRTLEALHRHAARATALLVLGALGACAPVVTATAPAPTHPGPQLEAEARAAAGRGTAAEDENIRVATGANVPGEAGEMAPGEKAPEGEAARGGSSCMVHFDNRTRLYISTYADGTYRGALGPWGDIYTYVIPGPTRLYARASFTDGSVSTWGPTMVSCPPAGRYAWRLYW